MHWYEVDAFLGNETVPELRARIKRLEDELVKSRRRSPTRTPPGDPGVYTADVKIHVDPGPTPGAAEAIRRAIEASSEARMRR